MRRQEETILEEAKVKSSLATSQQIKKARNATITQSERKTLSKLADLGFHDEVINIIFLLLDLNKTQPANLNESMLWRWEMIFLIKGSTVQN